MGWSEAGDKFKNPWKKQRNRLPAISVSAMDNLTQGFNFVVSMNAFTYGFKEVSGIEIENPIDEIPEGGVNDHPLVVGKPNSNIKELSFKRGLIMRSPTLISDAAKALAAAIPINLARRAALIAINALDPQESLESAPSLGTIQVYSRTGELTGLYNFVSVGLKSWKIDDLSATDDSVLIEEITIYHTGITRMPVTIVPALFAPTSYNEDRNVWDADAAAERWRKAQENKENQKKVQAQIAEEAKERREESNERKLDAEMNKLLDEARKILGDDFEKFAGDLKALLNGQGSIEEKLKKLEEEKVKLKDEIDEYYSKENIEKRREEKKEETEKEREEQAKNREKVAEEKRKEEQERLDKVEEEKKNKKNENQVDEKNSSEEQETNKNDKNSISEKQEEKRKEMDEKNKKRKEEAEKRAAEAREKAERRKEELNKIREEQAEKREKVEEEKRKAEQERLDKIKEEKNREEDQLNEQNSSEEQESDKNDEDTMDEKEKSK